MAARAPRARLLTKRERQALPLRAQLAVLALEWHLWLRIAQRLHEPVELDPATGHLTIFLTASRMRLCLQAIGSPLRGEHFARECIERLKQLGLIEDTGRVKKPRLSDADVSRRKGFHGSSPTEGGVSAQASPLRSVWWRVFRLPTLPTVALSPSTGTAWLRPVRSGRNTGASLSALLRCQPLVKSWARPSGFAPGSVQWAFHNSGPP